MCQNPPEAAKPSDVSEFWPLWLVNSYNRSSWVKRISGKVWAAVEQAEGSRVREKRSSAARAWVYERGRWVEARNPLEDGSNNPAEELERLGFERHEALKLGDPYGFSVRVYEAEDTVGVDAAEGPTEVEFLVTLETHLRWYPVFVADLPSLTHLLGELRPILSGGTR